MLGNIVYEDGTRISNDDISCQTISVTHAFSGLALSTPYLACPNKSRQLQ
jgi:hypothetical protein